MKAIGLTLVLVALTSIVDGAMKLSPTKGWIDEACVHEVTGLLYHEGGELMMEGPNGEVTVIPKCNSPPSHGSAWKTWTQFRQNTTQEVDYQSGQWVVPPAPTQVDAQTLFFWNGVEPLDNSAVLQPVLQWGESAAGGGSYWAVASWYVSGTHGSFYSALQQVESNDTITGTVVKKGKTYSVHAYSNLTGKESSIEYKPVDGPYVFAYQVLEAYTLSSCSDYPITGEVVFSNISVTISGKSVTPDWQVETQQPITCGEHSTVQSATEVTIKFKTS